MLLIPLAQVICRNEYRIFLFRRGLRRDFALFGGGHSAESGEDQDCLQLHRQPYDYQQTVANLGLVRGKGPY